MSGTPDELGVVTVVVHESGRAARSSGDDPPVPPGTATTTVERAARIPDTLEVLTSKANFWATALSIEHDRLSDWQRRLGYPVVVVTALTGLAAFSQLESNPAWWATLAVGVASFLAAALAAVQTQANFQSRAATAAESSAKFGALFGTMLRAADRLQAGEPVDVDVLYEEYSDLKSTRPSVSTKVRARAHEELRHEAAELRALAESRSR